jgi:RNA polymerase sigma-32 factor
VSHGGQSPIQKADAKKDYIALRKDIVTRERPGLLSNKGKKRTTNPKIGKKARIPKGKEKTFLKYDLLQRYLMEINKHKLLTRNEEHDLAVRAQEYGDRQAAHMLVVSNLRLVVKIALEYQRVWMQNLLDLIQEGNTGLLQAVRKFDPYKGVKFSYYASFWIKAYILKSIMDNWRLVKMGTTQGQRKLFFNLQKEKQRLILQGFEPQPNLLAYRLGVSERDVIDMSSRLDGWDVSLDAPLRDDSEGGMLDILRTESESADQKIAKKEMKFLLHKKISKFRRRLTRRELEILDLRIISGNPLTLQDLGARHRISRERVRQIEKNIMKEMRAFFREEIPDFASYSPNTSDL